MVRQECQDFEMFCPLCLLACFDCSELIVMVDFVEGASGRLGKIMDGERKAPQALTVRVRE